MQVTDLQKEYKRSFVDRCKSLDQKGRPLKTKLLNEALEIVQNEVSLPEIL